MCRESFFSVCVLVLGLAVTNAALGVVTWEANISSGNDAVEDQLDRGMYLTSSDLEFPNDGGLQVIGLRYVGVGVPRRATITKAYVQFTQDETTGPEAVNLIIDGELTPDASPFTSADRNVVSRSRTMAQVPWSPEPWPTTGAKYRTSDISSVIAEIVSQDGWAMGNALVIIISDDPDNPSVGNRVAESGTGAPSPLLHVEYTSLFAHRPNPADGAMINDTWVSLSWLPGETAVSHDVYFSDNFNDVRDGAGPGSPGFYGNRATTDLLAGFPGFPYPDGLVPGTTYYWRIDEVEANGTTKHKGFVWRFGVPPKTAYNPNPPDGAEFVGPDNVTLSWTAGFGAKLHTVYFGTDFDVVDSASGGFLQGLKTYNPGPLELEKVYYWRVDEFDAVAWSKGDVWSFTTPGAVGNPRPAYGATDVPMNAVLSWTPADSAASHRLYFGTGKEAVRNADTSSPEYKGSKALGAESYDPGLLEVETSYSWRVDEVGAQGNVAKGPLWVFTTGSSLLIDDFESYTDDDAAGEAIWQTWIDGFGVADNGAQVGYLLPPYAEQTIVHGGLQSMPLTYDNVAGVRNSEALLSLTTTRDWTEAGVVELSLWFRGHSANAAEPLYVAVSNPQGTPAVAVHDDAGAAQIGAWREWVIPLQTLADQGINLTNVDKLAIGLGSKGNAAASGGSGTIYIDDIRLHRPRD